LVLFITRGARLCGSFIIQKVANRGICMTACPSLSQLRLELMHRVLSNSSNCTRFPDKSVDELEVLIQMARDLESEALQ
jgi:hypothetical protein